MLNILVKKFVQDSENVKNTHVRQSYGFLLSIISIVCNIILFASKFIVGSILNSVSVIADSFNNLSDSVSSIISLISFKVCSKPADSGHPFGHGRFEYISTLMVSFIIIILGYEFFKSSFDKILNPTPVEYSLPILIILIFAIALKFWLSKINKIVGKKISSDVLIATSEDAKNDCIITSLTVVSIIITKFTGVIIDGFAGIIVSIFLLKTGYTIARDMLSQLIGESIDNELAKSIKQDILGYDGVLGVHDLIIHNYGPTHSMATVHVEVPINISIQITHQTIDIIEREIGKKYNLLLVIHMDPVDTEDKRIMNLSEIVTDALKSYEDVNAHDFRIINGEPNSNFVFELEVPHEYSQKQIDDLSKLIKQESKKVDSKCNCIIEVEFGYVKK